MADDQAPLDGADAGIPPVEADPIKNLKSEVNRKLDNVVQQNQALTEQLNALMGQLNEKANANARSAQPAAKPLRELIYDDPDAALGIMKNEVLDTVNRQSMTNYKIQELQMDYPELRDPNSAASKRAIAIHKSLSPHLQGTSEGAEMAILKAAKEMDLLPASKRAASRSVDDFQTASSSGGSKQRSPKSSEINKKTEIFAQLLNQAAGREYTDKVKEGVKEFSKRDFRRFGKYKDEE